MFTGIVQDLGKIIKRKIKGDSIKFTVSPTLKNFEFTTINESLSKTNLGMISENDYINLEKAMKLNSKLDGHIVQGHVDITGIVKKIIPLKGSYEFFIEFSSRFRNNIIYVGSIAVNGVSLTVAEIVRETKKSVLIKVAIIPYTMEITNFRFLKAGDKVNIEFDLMGKYVQRILKK